MLNEIKSYISNDLRRPKRPQVDPFLVKELPRCTECVRELKEPLRLSTKTSISRPPTPPFVKTEAETNSLPERPLSKQLLPTSRFPQLFGAVAVSGPVKKRHTNSGKGHSGKPEPLKEPYTLYNSIIHSGSHLIADDLVDLVEENARPRASISRLSNGEESYLIQQAQRHSFDKV